MRSFTLETITDTVGDHTVARNENGGVGRIILLNKTKAAAATSKLAQQQITFHSTITNNARTIAAVSGDLSLEGRRKYATNPDNIRPTITGYRSIASAANSRLAELDNQIAELSAPAFDPKDAAGASRRLQIRDALRGMGTGDAFKTAFADRDAIDAILELPSIVGFSPDLVERLRERRMLHTLTDRYAERHKLKPTADRPLASGVDMAAAEKSAREASHAIHQSRDEIGEIEMLLRGAVQLVAVIADVQPDESHRLLAG